MRESTWLDRIRDLFTRRTAVRDIRENPLLRASVARASEIFQQTPLVELLDESKQNALSRRLYLELNEVCNASQPRVVCRDKLVASMLSFAPLQVVMIPPPPAEDESGLRKLPGITGELHTRLADLLSADTDLRTKIAMHATNGAGAAADDASRALQLSYWANYWFLESFNATRIEIGDTLESGDWYRPFMHAACANQEDVFRRKLDLPPAFEKDIAQVVVTAFSIYTDVVVSGADDPDREWQDYCVSTGVPLIGNGTGMRA